MLLSPSLPWNSLSMSRSPPSWLIPRSMFSLHLTRLFAARATLLHCLLQFLGHRSLSSCPAFPEALNLSHVLVVPPHLLVPTSKCWSSSGLSHWKSFLSILLLLLLSSNFMIWIVSVCRAILCLHLHLWSGDIHATYPTSFSTSLHGCLIGICELTWPEPNPRFCPQPYQTHLPCSLFHVDQWQRHLYRLQNLWSHLDLSLTSQIIFISTSY